MKFHSRAFEWGFYDPQMSSSIDGTDLFAHDRAVCRAYQTRYKRRTNSSKYFIGHVPPLCCENDLKILFPQGQNIEIIRDIVTREPKGYAFADGFIDRTKTYRFNEHLLLIEDVASRKLLGWKPRRCGGGFGGQKQSGQMRFGGSERPFRKPFPHRLNQQIEKRIEFLKKMKK